MSDDIKILWASKCLISAMMVLALFCCAVLHGSATYDQPVVCGLLMLSAMNFSKDLPVDDDEVKR